MPNRITRQKFTTGVSLEPDVVEYLNWLECQTDLNRSWLLNAIVREYVRALGERAQTRPAPHEAIIRI